MFEICMIVPWKIFVKSIFLGLEQQNTRILECSFCLQPHPRTGWLLFKKKPSHNRLYILSWKIFQSMTIGLIILSIDFVVCLFSIWSSEVSPFQRSLFPGGLMGDHQDERLLGVWHEATVLGGVLRETRDVGKSWFLLVLGWTSFWQYYKVIDWSVGKFRWWRKKVFLRPFNIHNQLA